MRHAIPLLVLSATGLGLVACTAEPVPSGRAGGHVAITAAPDDKEPRVTTIEPSAATDSRIPSIDREAPLEFETATFALG